MPKSSIKQVIRAVKAYIIEWDCLGLRLYYSDGTTDMLHLADGVDGQLKEYGPPADHGEWLKTFHADRG